MTCEECEELEADVIESCEDPVEPYRVCSRPPIFPEKWNVAQVDEKQVRLKVRVFESAAEARQSAELLAFKDRRHEYELEKVPGRWATLF